jgi:Flp pilus assembly protein TadG
MQRSAKRARAKHFVVSAMAARLARKLRPRAFIVNEIAAMAVTVALALPFIIGVMGIGIETSYWRIHQRSMQYAADAAAIAAATNEGPTYRAEALAVAAQMGFPNSGTITVTASAPATATGCAVDCYVVSITDTVPLSLSRVVGYLGDATLSNGQPAKTIAVTSVASTALTYKYCILALATSGANPGILSHGEPDANLNGCDTMSNTDNTCTGHNMNAGVANAAGTSSVCGATQNSNVPVVSDPYSGLAANIPANTCASYPQETGKNGTVPASNQWNGLNYNLSGYQILCGDQKLTGNTSFTSASNLVLVIENGQLDTAGFTLANTGSGGLTVVFTGNNGATYTYAPTGGGTLNIDAPTSGPWGGVAIYQDPSLTNGVNIYAAGNTPTWNITGLVYLPHSSVTLSGAVNKSANGAQCMLMVVDNITVNGTGGIFANDTGCAAAGLINQPGGGARGTIVN